MQTIFEMIGLILRYFRMRGNTNSLNYPYFNKKMSKKGAVSKTGTSTL